MTPLTIAWQSPLSIGFSRQGYWSGLPFPSPGALPNTRIEAGSPALQVDSLPLSHLGEAQHLWLGNKSAFLWPRLRFHNLLKQHTEFRKIFNLLFPICHEGYHNGYKWTARWRGPQGEIWMSPQHRSFCPWDASPSQPVDVSLRLVFSWRVSFMSMID